MVNACLRCIGGKWWVGTVGALVRTFLLIAVTMASARMRIAGAEPSAAFSVALFSGPAISLSLTLAAFLRARRREVVSTARAVADPIVTSWGAVAAIDVVFLVVGVAGRLLSTRS